MTAASNTERGGTVLGSVDQDACSWVPPAPPPLPTLSRAAAVLRVSSSCISISVIIALADSDTASHCGSWLTTKDGSISSSVTHTLQLGCRDNYVMPCLTHNARPPSLDAFISSGALGHTHTRCHVSS